MSGPFPIRHWMQVGFAVLAAFASPVANAVTCDERNTWHADLAALDMPLVFNRLGAQNVNWQVYALWHDLVSSSSGGASLLPPMDKLLAVDPRATAPFSGLTGKVAIRPDLRPRPLALRVPAGSCLHVRFVNLLTKISNPNDATQPVPSADHPMNQREHDPLAKIDDEVASRVAGFHPQGLELVRSIADDSSYVGTNANSMPAPGQWREYWFHAPHEGAFLVSNPGAVFGGEGTAGTAGTGLFGVVAVQPEGARFYRGQVTEEELRAATTGSTPHGQPVLNYEARYGNDCPSGPWCLSGKVGRPILNMVDRQHIVHGDLNAVIVGPNADGSFPPKTYPLESTGKRNPTLPSRLEPFREFVSVFHDENAVAQAFPRVFNHSGAEQNNVPIEDNPLTHTLHGVRDAFMINYGSGGVGAEVVANRIGVGPMHDCVDCAFEEFFLSSFTVGDPAMLVDTPANIGLVDTHPVQVGGDVLADMARVGLGPKSVTNPKALGPKARYAFYPHDPANVHHSYLGDQVKFRNVHVGKEQHIFHLHNHQWLFNPNDDNANYIDAQAIGPGSGYTYEIAFGGSGNRNKSSGDAVFHCHFYPHFAQGMWYLWRIHDTFEAGTALAVSQSRERKPFDLRSGLPAKGARALPDGEIVAGTPIPAVVPLPGKALAPMPGKVEVVENPRKSIHNGKPVGSLAKVDKVPDASKPEIEWQPKANPGYPFWIAGIEHTVGSRPPTPPLDMDPAAGGQNGGLPRHTVAGLSALSVAKSTFHRLSADKHEEKVRPVYFPETGTGVERFVMDWHAQKEHKTSAVLPDGTVHATVFRTNGGKPVAGAPFFEPCMDDRREPLDKSSQGRFFSAALDARSMIDRQQPGDPGSAALFGQFGGSAFDARTPRIYKGANIQLDVVFNKLGQHFGQQRILALWEDVGPLLEPNAALRRAPEPLVLRMNTFDCATYLHTNLVPKAYEVDDYQITTPTDVIGQHIHLPKWDLPSADGSTNGWNYEDGTFAPAMVRNRIKAINAWNAEAASHGLAPVAQLNGSTAPLAPAVHGYFSGANFAATLQQPGDECLTSWQKAHDSHALEEWERSLGLPRHCDWLGARTTIQRWFSDPVINTQHRHRGLGITFTHDHLGPSTHQQVGLYATMLSEPPQAVWRHNETGQALYDRTSRTDGGPTSWQAVITGCNKHVDDDPHKPCAEYGPLATDKHLAGHASAEDSHREFFLQYGDFQHAYQKGEHFGVDASGKPALPTPDSFRVAVNPSVRKPASPNLPDIAQFEPICPGSQGSFGKMARPCPEVISADDIGMMVVNYRNEPVAARVYDGSRVAMTDGKKGTQAAFSKGDLAYAYQTRTDRKILVLNGVGGEVPGDLTSQPHYPTDINAQRLPGDPFTPMIRAYSGDLVRIKIQAGSHEHEHNGTIHGLKWLQGGSGYGESPNSGWRNAQNAGLSEQFTFTASIVDYEPSNQKHLTDRLWAIDTSQDGLWTGVWGVIRIYSRRDQRGETPVVEPLLALPQNPLPTLLSTREFDPKTGYTNDCGIGDGQARVVRSYSVLAVLANQVLDNPLSSWIPPGVPGLNSTAIGGTLTYNHRKTQLSLQIRDDNGVVTDTKHYGLGPLHDPTAIMLVREEDYDAIKGKLKPGVAVEPIVLRAKAGDCVRVTLKNLLPRERWFTPMPDLNGYTSLSHQVTREASNSDSAMTGFNNNLLRPSHHIALHPQLVHYDASVFDGSVVGLNIDKLVAPGEEHLYQWYAGDLFIPRHQIQACTKPAVNPKATLADIDRLRQRVVGGRLLRSSVELNSPLAVASRLLALLDPLTAEEAQQIDRLQSGPPLEPRDAKLTGEPVSRAIVVTLPSDQKQRSALKLVVPRQVLPNAQASTTLEPLLMQLLSSLLSQARSLGCLDELDEPTTLRGAAEAERDQFLAKVGLRLGDDRFVVDSAPLLPLLQAYDRIGRDLLAASVNADATRDRRQVCAQQLIEPARTALLDNPRLAEQITRERLQQAAERWPASFAYRVPGVDRDVFVPERGTPSFRWFDPQYRPLTTDTTRVVALDPKACRFEPIEYGGTNLSPPDRIKQGQKGAVGAMVIEPPVAIWAENGEDSVFDHQAGVGDRRSRATATVLYDRASGQGLERIGGFRDFAAVLQKGQNLRYGKRLADGESMGAVAVLAAERADDSTQPARVAPEDPHDSGHMGINYGTEPMWFRFGMPPDAPFGHGGKPSQPRGIGLGGTQYAWQAFSNSGCCNSDLNQPSATASQPAGQPAVPVFPMLYPGGQSRLRLLMPTGVGRGSTMHLHGHAWRRDPYLAGGSGVPSQCIGTNPNALWMGGQESLTPMAHFDFVLDRTGGDNRVRGEFALRDQAGFGITNGVWSVVRNHFSRASPFIGTLLAQPLKDVCP